MAARNRRPSMFICISGQDRTGHKILLDTNDIIIPFLFFFLPSLQHSLLSIISLHWIWGEGEGGRHWPRSALLNRGYSARARQCLKLVMEWYCREQDAWMSNCNSTHLSMVVIVPRNAENNTGHLKSGFPDTWAVTVLRRSPGYLYYTWIAYIC